MSESNDILPPIHLVTAGVMILLLRFLPQPWLQSQSFGSGLAILGSIVLLLGLLRLFKKIDTSSERRWLLLALAGSLVLLGTALWEIDRSSSAPDVLWLRGMLWTMGSLTFPCVASLLGKLCRQWNFHRAEARWRRVRAWSLGGLTPSLLGTAMATPYGSYEALQGASPALIHRSFFGLVVNVSNLSSWLKDLTPAEQAAFWIWLGFSVVTALVTMWLLWKTSLAFRETWRFLDDPKSAEATIAWEGSSGGRLSQVALLLFWAALLQAVSYSSVIFELWISVAFFGTLLGVIALLRLRPLAVDADLSRAWTLSWAGLWTLLAADVLGFRLWETSSVWNVVILGGTLLGFLALPTFSGLMRELCRRQELGNVAARWDRVRRLALFGILPLLSLHFVSYLVVWGTTSDVWISGWGLLGIGPGYWPLALSWEVLKIALWVVSAWTWLRFLYAASSGLRSYRSADDSDATPAPNPLFSMP